MDVKKLLLMLGFKPKDNAIAVYSKIYQQHDSYAIEVDFSKEFINYGKLIKADCKTTQNFSQDENWVVLECVDRLLTKGYKPQNIILEKTWAAGHRASSANIKPHQTSARQTPSTERRRFPHKDQENISQPHTLSPEFQTKNRKIWFSCEIHGQQTKVFS